MGVSDEESREEGLTVPMDKGDLLLMHKGVPHRSTLNLTDTVRWSMDLRYQETGTPTGRPFHPDFVARSRSNPGAELKDYDLWSKRWVESLEEIRTKTIKSHRWELVE